MNQNSRLLLLLFLAKIGYFLLFSQVQQSPVKNVLAVTSFLNGLPFEEYIAKYRISPDDPSKRYVCPFCRKEFYSRNDFRRHYMSHTGEKPFACKFCSFRATVGAKVRYHSFRVHPEQMVETQLDQVNPGE